jgi:hypothetical protein
MGNAASTPPPELRPDSGVHIRLSEFVDTVFRYAEFQLDKLDAIPNNSHVQSRISQTQWNRFVGDMKTENAKHHVEAALYVGGLYVAICFVLLPFLFPEYSTPFMILGGLLVLGSTMHSWHLRSKRNRAFATIVAKYNKFVFRPRGLLVSVESQVSSVLLCYSI